MSRRAAVGDSAPAVSPARRRQDGNRRPEPRLTAAARATENGYRHCAAAPQQAEIRPLTERLLTIGEQRGRDRAGSAGRNGD
jgi:hypothetical protein